MYEVLSQLGKAAGWAKETLIVTFVVGCGLSWK